SRPPLPYGQKKAGLQGRKPRIPGYRKRRTSLAQLFLDPAFDRAAFHEAQAVDEEAPVEVVELVLDRDGQKAIRLESMGFPRFVLVFDRNPLGALHLFVFTGNAQATLFHELAA